MKVEALNHIADVGIATNLVLGIFDAYRGWVKDRTRAVAEDARNAYATALLELDGKTHLDDIPNSKTIAKLSRLVAQLDAGHSVVQRIFAVIAPIAALVLMGFLYVGAVYGDVECVNPEVSAGAMIGLASGPTLVCWLLMLAIYAYIHARMWFVTRKYKNLAREVQDLRDTSIRPTDPDK